MIGEFLNVKKVHNARRVSQWYPSFLTVGEVLGGRRDS